MAANDTVRKPVRGLSPGTKPWPKGKSGNKGGRPKGSGGKSWSTIIKEVGAMKPSEAGKLMKPIAKQMAELGDKITLKEAVILRVYADLAKSANAGLLNSIMNRTDGRVPEMIELRDWRADAIAAGLDPDRLVMSLFQSVSPKIISGDADDSADNDDDD